MYRARKLLTVTLGLLAVLLLPPSGDAVAKWPTRQVNIVVPFSPGGTTDRIARALGPFLEKELGVPVVLVNRKGGGGLIGTKAHLKSDPADGSYIVYTIEPYLSGAVVKGAFKLNDFDYLAANYWSPQGLWVNGKSHYQSAPQLFADIKAKPNKITMSVIPNSWSRAGNALLGQRLGAKAKGIPYHGGGKQRMAVIKNDVVCTITEVYGTLASAAADMRCLAVFADRRLPELPDVPTINEVMQQMGLQPIPALSNFRFFMVKKGFKQAYPERWQMLVDALKRAIEHPEYQQMMAKQKLKIVWKSPEETTKLVYAADRVLQQFAEFWK